MKLVREVGVACVAILLLCATSCNTVRGVGKDIEEGGEEIQDVATEVES